MKNEQVNIKKYHIFQKAQLPHNVNIITKNLDFFQVQIPQNTLSRVKNKKICQRVLFE